MKYIPCVRHLRHNLRSKSVYKIGHTDQIVMEMIWKFYPNVLKSNLNKSNWILSLFQLFLPCRLEGGKLEVPFTSIDSAKINILWDLFFFLLERKVSRVLSLYRDRAKEKKKKTCWDNLEKTSFSKKYGSIVRGEFLMICIIKWQNIVYALLLLFYFVTKSLQLQQKKITFA